MYFASVKFYKLYGIWSPFSVCGVGCIFCQCKNTNSTEFLSQFFSTLFWVCIFLMRNFINSTVFGLNLSVWGVGLHCASEKFYKLFGIWY